MPHMKLQKDTIKSALKYSENRENFEWHYNRHRRRLNGNGYASRMRRYMTVEY